jgi:hypothetical protein
MADKIPRAGHAVNIDRPERFNEVLTAFLERVTTDGILERRGLRSNRTRLRLRLV